MDSNIHTYIHTEWGRQHLHGSEEKGKIEEDDEDERELMCGLIAVKSTRAIFLDWVLSSG